MQAGDPSRRLGKWRFTGGSSAGKDHGKLATPSVSSRKQPGEHLRNDRPADAESERPRVTKGLTLLGLFEFPGGAATYKRC